MEKLSNSWAAQNLYNVYAASVCNDSDSFEKFVEFMKGNKEGYAEFESEYLNDVRETLGEVNLELMNFYKYDVENLENLALTSEIVSVLKEFGVKDYDCIVDLTDSFGNSAKLGTLGIPVKKIEELNIVENPLCLVSLKQCDNLMLYIKDLEKDMVLVVPSLFLDSIKSQNFHKFLAEKNYLSKTLKSKDCLGTNSKNTFTVFYLSAKLTDSQALDGVKYFEKEDLEILVEYNITMPRFSDTGEPQDAMIKVPINFLGFMKNNFKTKLKADIFSYQQGYALTITKDNLCTMAEYYTMLNMLNLDTSRRIPRYSKEHTAEFTIASVIYMLVNNPGIINYSTEWPNRLRVTQLEALDEHFEVLYLDSYILELINSFTPDTLNTDLIKDSLGFVNELREKYKNTVNNSSDITAEDIQLLGVHEFCESIDEEGWLEDSLKNIEREIRGLCNL